MVPWMNQAADTRSCIHETHDCWRKSIGALFAWTSWPEYQNSFQSDHTQKQKVSLVHLPIRFEISHVPSIGVPSGPPSPTSRTPTAAKIISLLFYLFLKAFYIGFTPKTRLKCPLKRDDFNRKPDHLNKPSFAQSENVCFQESLFQHVPLHANCKLWHEFLCWDDCL